MALSMTLIFLILVHFSIEAYKLAKTQVKRV
jgi:hypothetical protein